MTNQNSHDSSTDARLQPRVLYSLLGRIIYATSLEELDGAGAAIKESCANEATRCMLRIFWIERRREILANNVVGERVCVDPT